VTQAGVKADKSKDKLKAGTGTGPVKRSVSWNELQPQGTSPPDTGSLGNQKIKPASKRILQKLTHAPAVGGKVFHPQFRSFCCLSSAFGTSHASVTGWGSFLSRWHHSLPYHCQFRRRVSPTCNCM
jgi:hypothetical protein